jgi:hypothetical protein
MKPNKKSAAALPLVLWCVMFLAGLVVMGGALVNRWLEGESLAQRKFVARQMALTGVAIGMNPAIPADSPLLRSGSPEGEGYEVSLASESGRVNPNYWLAQSNNAIFQRLFEAWGHDLDESDTAINGLVDWIDGDDFASARGAERKEYEAAGRPGYPANRPLSNVREMESVMNLRDILMAHGGWRDYFTTWHVGPLDIHDSPDWLLADLVGFSPRQIETIVQFRAGPDGIERTTDDQKFPSIEAVEALAGADGRQSQALRGFFSTGGGVGIYRIESTGFCNGASHRIIVIGRQDGKGRIFSWQEL